MAEEPKHKRWWRLDSVAAGAVLALLLFAIWQVVDQWVLSEKLRVRDRWLYFTLDDVVETSLALIVLMLVVRALRARSRELAELNRQKDLLTNLLVHDLRQPLAALLGSLSLARRDPMNVDETQAMIGIAEQSGTLLARMLEDLLDVSRLEARHALLASAPVRPRAFIEAAVAELASRAQQQRIDLRADLASDTPPVAGDSGRLQRVVANLVDNALRYTPAGGRVEVKVGPDAAGARVVISVSDTGAGIPEALQRRVFEKFWTGEPAASSTRRSFGLGLTFCKMIVEAHGGRIWVESEPGKGTIFRFSLPCVVEHPRTG